MKSIQRVKILRPLKAALETLRDRFRDGGNDFAHLAESIPHLVWVMGSDGQSLYFNQRWTEYTGVSAGHAAKWEDIIHGDDIPAAQAAWELSLRSGSPYSVEYRIKKTDGTYRWHLTRAQAMRNTGGKVLKWFGTCTDIDDQKKAEESLEQQVAARTEALKSAQQSLVQTAKMTALGEMAGGIAHEINNPLAIISAKAQLLMKMTSAPSMDGREVARHLEGIDKTVFRIASIIMGLKAFSRNGENDPSQNELVSAVIDSTLALCQEKFKKHGVDLRRGEIPEAFLRCRSVQISQVILNLLNNAFDAVCGLEEKWIQVEVRLVSGSVELSFTDSGSGVPVEVRHKIMQPFFTTKPIGQGTGLGLSISKGIIEDHGGTLKLDHNAQKTRFVIMLPEAVVRAEKGISAA